MEDKRKPTKKLAIFQPNQSAAAPNLNQATKKKQKPNPQEHLPTLEKKLQNAYAVQKITSLSGTTHSTVQSEVEAEKKIWNSQHLPDDDAKCDYTKNDNDVGLERNTHTHTHVQNNQPAHHLHQRDNTVTTTAIRRSSSYTLNSGPSDQPSASANRRRAALLDFCFLTAKQ